ncbi:hypothetical protein [Streptomyces antibioticus]|uniref:hypothetical protein n=1 Tax=Streptomyces antibioticus TaxID=1890 RepID=UPI0036F786D2
MARLQILPLPGGVGDERPPFVLVVDQYQPMRYVLGIDQGEPEAADEFAFTAEQIGARAVLVFAETVEIPAGGPLPLLVADGVERDGTTQLVDAHERTRLDLCDALLLSRDTTWRTLVEAASERQRAVARLARQVDRVQNLPETPSLMDAKHADPNAYLHGYRIAIGDARRAARDERPPTADYGG